MGIASLISGSDVRGKAIGEGAPLTEAVGHRLGQAFVRYLKDHGVAAPKVAVGRDPRLSGERLEAAIAEGMASAGAQVTCFGLATTPAMFMALVRPEFGGDASVMVTASHLPWERNGYKFFLPDGGITGKTLKEILALADSDADFTAPGGSVSRMDFLPVYAGLLEEKIRTELGGESPLSGLKVAVDAGNGAGGFYAALLSDLGADTSGSQFLEPDGHFPNHIPNPENPDAMDAISRAVLESHSDLGVIFDTDCDRAAIVDAGGREINRNRLIALISAVLLTKEPGATIVTDSVTSSGLADFIAAHGGVDVDGVVPDAEELHQAVGVADVRLHAVGHQHAHDVLLAVGLAAQRRNDARILAAGDADDGGLAVARLHLRAHPVEQPGQLLFGVEIVHSHALPHGFPLDSGRKTNIIVSKNLCIKLMNLNYITLIIIQH